jgi:hypothetical protein
VKGHAMIKLSIYASMEHPTLPWTAHCVAHMLCQEASYKLYISLATHLSSVLYCASHCDVVRDMPAGCCRSQVSELLAVHCGMQAVHKPTSVHKA